MGITTGKIPLWLKLLFTAFLGVLVPYYWHAYGSWNFMNFCDLALLLTLLALWTENRLLASMAAVGIVLPQLLWVVDFLGRLILGRGPFGMTEYMFNPQLTLFVRGLSLFHGWLPFLLLWLVWRLGYDRRAFYWQTLLMWTVLLVCFFFSPLPPAPVDDQNRAVNINYVFAFPWDETQPQHVMPPFAWLAVLMALHPLCFLLPTHLLLSRWGSRLVPSGSDR